MPQQRLQVGCRKKNWNITNVTWTQHEPSGLCSCSFHHEQKQTDLIFQLVFVEILYLKLFETVKKCVNLPFFKITCRISPEGCSSTDSGVECLMCFWKSCCSSMSSSTGGRSWTWGRPGPSWSVLIHEVSSSVCETCRNSCEDWWDPSQFHH